MRYYPLVMLGLALVLYVLGLVSLKYDNDADEDANDD